MTQPGDEVGGRIERPRGPLSGRRTSWRRVLGRALVGGNQLLFRFPPGRWLHRRLRLGLEISAPGLRLDRPRMPPALDVVFLSDLHAGFYMTADDLTLLARRVNALEPDLVCLGGDLVDSDWEQVRLLEQALEILSPRLGTWAVTGNHESYGRADIGRWREYLVQRGVRVLCNEGARVEVDGGSLWVAGVDDLTEGQPDVAAALAGRDPDEPALLLSHHPDVFPVAAELGVDVQLSGHTHGGQTLLFGWMPLVHSRLGYHEGAHRLGEAWLYVGRGVGVTVLPLRLGVPAEVVLVELRG